MNPRRILVVAALAGSGCHSPTAPTALGPGCTLSIPITTRQGELGSFDQYTARCPAPAYVTTWTAHFTDGTTQTYRVIWDGSAQSNGFR